MSKELKRKGKVVGYSLSFKMYLKPDEMQGLKRICDYFGCDDWDFMHFAFWELAKMGFDFMEDNPDEKEARLEFLDDELLV